MIPNVRKKRSIRYILYDTNFWKSFYRERLLTAPGDPGSLTVYGDNKEYHRDLAEQLSSETSEATTGRGRRVDIWKMIPGRDNHFLDCLIGNMVAANEKGNCMLGACRQIPAAAVPGVPEHHTPRRFTGNRRFTARRKSGV